jgi:hypothetical protein
MPLDLVPLAADVARVALQWLKDHVAEIGAGGVAAYASWTLTRPAKPAIQKRFLRGASIITAPVYAKSLRRREKASAITVAGVPLPAEASAQHGLIAASTGAGKSTALAHPIHEAWSFGVRQIAGAHFCSDFRGAAGGTFERV